MFVLRLEILGNLEPFSQTRIAIEQDEGIYAFIQEMCELLENTNLVRFVVGGFGQEIWPVDVATDLSVILEQLPEVIRSLSNETFPFSLDFYEQGIERRLVFEKKSDLIKVRCFSDTKWIPNPSEIELTKADLLSQLLTLKKSFVEVVEIIYPELSINTLLDMWQV